MDISIRATFVFAVDMSRTLDELTAKGVAAAVADLKLCALAGHVVFYSCNK